MGFFKNTGIKISPLTRNNKGEIWDGDEWVKPTKDMCKGKDALVSRYASVLGYTTISSYKALAQYIPEKARGCMVFVQNESTLVVSEGDKWVFVIGNEKNIIGDVQFKVDWWETPFDQPTCKNSR